MIPIQHCFFQTSSRDYFTKHACLELLTLNMIHRRISTFIVMWHYSRLFTPLPSSHTSILRCDFSIGCFTPCNIVGRSTTGYATAQKKHLQQQSLSSTLLTVLLLTADQHPGTTTLPPTNCHRHHGSQWAHKPFHKQE